MLQEDTGAGGEASDMLRCTGQQLVKALGLPAQAILKYLLLELSLSVELYGFCFPYFLNCLSKIKDLV